MPRRIVSLAAAVFIVTSIACSDATEPSASRALMASTQTASSAMPFTPVAHTSIIAGLDPNVATATAMNDFGEVVGYYFDATLDGNVPFKWQGSHGLKIDTTSHYCIPVDVNNRGEIAMNCEAGTILQDWAGHNRKLGTLFHWIDPNNPYGVPACLLIGVADNGGAFGTCSPADDTTFYPTAWTPFGTPYTFFTGGSKTGFQGSGHQISHAAGYMAGDDSVTSTGFVRAPTGQLRFLPPAKNSSAYAVNDSGWAAGSLVQPLPQSPGRAVAWLRGDSIAFLNWNGEPFAMTNTGQVLIREDIIWTPRHRTLTLMPPLETGGNANTIAINNRNQILGITSQKGKLVYVIWTLPAGY